MPIGTLKQYKLSIMEVTAVIGLVLFLASEIMPYLPIKSNGLVQAVLEALMKVFPRPEAEEK